MSYITLLTADMVAQILCVDRSTIYKMVKAGKFPKSDVYSGHKRWGSDVVQLWILAQRSAA